MEITGTLIGLPIGPGDGPRPRRWAPCSSATRRSRSPSPIPRSSRQARPYTLDVTVTNTSESPANFVSLNLFPTRRQRRDASSASRPARNRDRSRRAIRQSVSFDLIAKVSGKVTAATLDSDENVDRPVRAQDTQSASSASRSRPTRWCCRRKPARCRSRCGPPRSACWARPTRWRPPRGGAAERHSAVLEETDLGSRDRGRRRGLARRRCTNRCAIPPRSC